MPSKPKSALPDYQQEFSLRSIKNYIAVFLVPFGTQGLSALLFSTYLSKTYTDYLGVNAAIMGLIISIGIIVDGVTDFLMGIVVDRVRTKWGKARHWFFVSFIPTGISMILMFMVPETASQTMKIVFIFVMYNLFCTFLTTVRLPAASLVALASDNVKIRNNMSWAYEVAAAVSSSALGWIATPLFKNMGENLQSLRLLTVICAVITMVSLLLIGLLSSEQRSGDDWKAYDEEYKKLHKQEKKETLGQQLANLFRNKWWVIWQVFQVFNQCGIFFIFGVLAYWLDIVLGDPTQVGSLMAALNLPVVVGSILYVLVSRFLSSRRLLMLTTFVGFICSLVMWIAGAQAWGILLVALAVKSFMGGLGSPATRAIIPQIIDYGEWKTGSRQEGLANAGTTVMSKIVSAAGTACVGFVLAAAGYAGAGTATAQAASGLNFLFLGVPCITIGIAFVVMLFFRLDDKDCDRYRAEIAERKAKLDAEK